MTKKILPILAYILLPLAVGGIFGVLQVLPPAADEGSPVFAKMIADIGMLSKKPHIVGSQELDDVRHFLIGEITDMGIQPIVHSKKYTLDEAYIAWGRLGRRSDVPVEPEPLPVPRPDSRFDILPEEFVVHNILVMLESPDVSARTILFASHYDSWPDSPGAADAATPIAAMLAAMRAQAGNRSLANNIYFLMTDGEEFGAVGMLAFINDHPEFKDKVDMIINMDAQGNDGALILFETSPDPYAMLDTFRQAVSRPLGFSIAQRVYDMMHTYTDFCFARQYGWNGINLAVIGGVEHYHRPSDNFRHINRNTAWHYLTTTLGLADYAAGNSLDRLSVPPPSGNTIFFPLMSGNLVIFSRTATYVLCVLAVLLALAVSVYRHGKKRKALFSSIVLLTLAVLSVISAVYFYEGSYLFWFALLAMSVTALLEGIRPLHIAATMISRTLALLLWVPWIYIISVFPFVPVSVTAAAAVALLLYFICCGAELLRMKKELGGTGICFGRRR